MKISNTTYDRLKWIASVFMPAFIALVGGLGQALNYANTDTVVTILGLINAFLGAIMVSGSGTYHKENEEGVDNE